MWFDEEDFARKLPGGRQILLRFLALPLALLKLGGKRIGEVTTQTRIANERIDIRSHHVGGGDGRHPLSGDDRRTHDGGEEQGAREMTGHPLDGTTWRLIAYRSGGEMAEPVPDATVTLWFRLPYFGGRSAVNHYQGNPEFSAVS